MSKLEWVDGALVKQTTPKQVKSIFEWTSAFIRFMGIYLQHHSGKSLELLHYMEIIRFASTKWTGFGREPMMSNSECSYPGTKTQNAGQSLTRICGYYV